jgi:hypothetical protein
MTSHPLGLVHSPTVYFSRAVDGIAEERTSDLTREVAAELESVGLTIVDPLGLYQETHSSRQPAEIVQWDLRLLQSATAVLADMSIPDRNYIGCVCELVYAHIGNKPAVVYTGESGYEQRPWLQYHSTRIFKDRKMAVAYLASIL